MGMEKNKECLDGVVGRRESDSAGASEEDGRDGTGEDTGSGPKVFQDCEGSNWNG